MKYIIALVLVLTLAGCYNSYQKDVVIRGEAGAVNVGKVTEEVLTFGIRVYTVDEDTSTGFDNLGGIPPKKYIDTLLKLALKDLYKDSFVFPVQMVVVIQTSVTYKGTIGVADKVIHTQKVVLKEGTTIDKALAAIDNATVLAKSEYEFKHSYLR